MHPVIDKPTTQRAAKLAKLAETGLAGLHTLAKWVKPEYRPSKLSAERRIELIMESVIETERQFLKLRAKLAADTPSEQQRAKLERLDELLAAMGLDPSADKSADT
jgi:hypothetical protein